MRAIEVYKGSNGDVTKAYYAQLTERGALGVIAVNLFRAHKCSSRAKKYRGGYKGMAYDRKNWSLTQLCEALSDYGGSKRCADPMITYGWKKDPSTPGYEWVLYVDLPQGQVSFHAASRGAGPDYAGEWCGDHLSADRIVAFCDNVMGESVSPFIPVAAGQTGVLTPEIARTAHQQVMQRLGFGKCQHPNGTVTERDGLVYMECPDCRFRAVTNPDEVKRLLAVKIEAETKFGMGSLHPEHATVTPSEPKQDSLFQTSGKES